MANPHRGEVAIQVGGVPYTLRFSINALCELEDHLGQGINAVAAMMADPEKIRLKTLRAVFWAALIDHHPNIDVRAAGDLLAEAGAANVMEKIAEAFSKAFPDNPDSHPQTASQ